MLRLSLPSVKWKLYYTHAHTHIHTHAQTKPSRYYNATLYNFHRRIRRCLDTWTCFSWFVRFVKCFFKNYRKTFDIISQRSCEKHCKIGRENSKSEARSYGIHRENDGRKQVAYVCTQAYYLKPRPRDEFSGEFEYNRCRTCVRWSLKRVPCSMFSQHHVTISRCKLTAL